MTQKYRFGVFELDPVTGELRREGAPVRLPPQPAKVLALMVARAGELVSREELRTHVWGTSTFVDFERGLNFCVAQIRTALGDAAESPRYVQTVPRRGYRFIAPTRTVVSPRADGTTERPPGARSGAPSDPPTDPQPLHATPSPLAAGRRVSRWALAAAAVTLVTASGLLVLRSRHALDAGVPAPTRVAIVPFDNETGDPALDGFARGLSDGTVAALAADSAGRLGVIGNAAVLGRPRAQRDLTLIRDVLGAEYVVLGQVQDAGGGLRVIAHLIRTDDQTHLWARRFDSAAADRASLLNDVPQEIARAIEERLTELSRGGAPRSPPPAS